MKKYILIALLFSSLKSFCQTVVNMPKSENKEESIINPYDSLCNITFGNTNNKSSIAKLKKYIGQDIIFYDFSSNMKDKEVGYINFESEPTLVRYDTIWLKQKQKIKPSHYTIDTIYSAKYQPQYFTNEDIGSSCCISSIQPEKVIRANNTSIMAEWQKWKPFTGYATPVDKINKQIFTIVDFETKPNHSNLYVKLKDKDNNLFFWVINNKIEPLDKTERYNYSRTMPIITQGFIDKMNSIYTGKKFCFIKDNQNLSFSQDSTIAYNVKGEITKLSKEIEYLFKEIQYVDIYGTYSVPCFLVADENDSNFFIPLCRVPTYSKHSENKVYEPKKGYFEDWAYMENLTFKSVDAINAEKELKELKKALEQKVKEEEAAKRKAQLTKKYGSTIATLILEEKVRVGMTAEMCEESWGKPMNINRSTGRWGDHEQWVYYGSNYLYFENGILSSIQN